MRTSPARCRRSRYACLSAEHASTAWLAAARACCAARRAMRSSHGQRSSSVSGSPRGHLGDVRRRMEIVGVEKTAAEAPAREPRRPSSCRIRTRPSRRGSPTTFRRVEARMVTRADRPAMLPLPDEVRVGRDDAQRVVASAEGKAEVVADMAVDEVQLRGRERSGAPRASSRVPAPASTITSPGAHSGQTSWIASSVANPSARSSHTTRGAASACATATAFGQQQRSSRVCPPGLRRGSANTCTPADARRRATAVVAQRRRDRSSWRRTLPTSLRPRSTRRSPPRRSRTRRRSCGRPGLRRGGSARARCRTPARARRTTAAVEAAMRERLAM